MFYINEYIIVKQEIFKLLMSQISSLKKLTYLFHPQITFTIYPGAKDGFKNLSELECSSNVNPKFFYQISQICHNIQILNIAFNEVISNGLADLISVQNNLRHLYLDLDDYCSPDTILLFLY